MSARDAIWNAISESDWSLIDTVDHMTANVVTALRADPVAVLSLLPDEVLADIETCATTLGYRHAGQRLLALLLLAKVRES